MYWLFKFSGVVGVLLGGGAIGDREGMVGKDSFVSKPQ